MCWPTFPEPSQNIWPVCRATFACVPSHAMANAGLSYHARCLENPRVVRGCCHHVSCSSHYVGLVEQAANCICPEGLSTQASVRRLLFQRHAHGHDSQWIESLRVGYEASNDSWTSCGIPRHAPLLRLNQSGDLSQSLVDALQLFLASAMACTNSGRRFPIGTMMRKLSQN